MGIVGVFLLCHFLRVFLNLHEMVVIRQAMECGRRGYRPFPMWARIMNSFRYLNKLGLDGLRLHKCILFIHSHILLVFNSSTNMIIYCSLNVTFREHFMNMLR